MQKETANLLWICECGWIFNYQITPELWKKAMGIPSTDSSTDSP